MTVKLKSNSYVGPANRNQVIIVQALALRQALTEPMMTILSICFENVKYSSMKKYL